MEWTELIYTRRDLWVWIKEIGIIYRLRQMWLDYNIILLQLCHLCYSSFSLSNSLFSSAKKSLVNSNSVFPTFISFNKFFFYISTDSFYIYVESYCTYSFTGFFLSLILMYNLQVITNYTTCFAFLLNKDGCVISSYPFKSLNLI